MTDHHDHPVLMRQLPDDDVYRTGPNPGGTLFVIPAIWTGMPDDLLGLLRHRRRASVTGRCGICGAEIEPYGQARQIRHEQFCGLADDYLGPKLAGWARQVGRYARGRRITEDPIGE